MGQALYRKHRPKKLSEVVGQEHITETLQQALKQGRISHAYLFTGPRGVGKTSIARILAHEINGLPYTDDAAHLDIIEIDAASNRRIDEIRDLRDKVYIAPTSAKYKVYIIDEVHMLTREAFNALLKTLEEPPEHVVFILATTDAHKLPETIVSRTQRFSFKPVEKAKVVEHLRSMAAEEKITIDDAALQLLAEHGEGSFRDSISLLDQAGSHHQALTEDEVRHLLGVPPTESIEQLLALLTDARGDLATLAKALNELYDQGYQAVAIAKQLAQRLRLHLIDGTSQPSALSMEATTTLLAHLLEVPVSHDPERFLEITLLAALPQASVTIAPPPSEPESPTTQEAPEAAAISAEQQPEVEVAPDEPAIPKAASAKQPAKKNSQVDASIWPKVLSELKKHHNTLYGVVRMAEPSFDGETLTLAFAFDFHQKRLKDAKNQQLLKDIIAQVSGQNMRIECVVDKTVSSTPSAKLEIEAQPSPPDNATLSTIATISNIFGGGELLE